MENNSQNSEFQYTYSAKEQKELKKIQEKYSPKEETKLERLHRLDQSVTRKAWGVALVFGILGALVLGVGMSLMMTDFSAILGKWEANALPVGILIGVVGLILGALSYPLYRVTLRREKEKKAPEILRLTEELMK